MAPGTSGLTTSCEVRAHHFEIARPFRQSMILPANSGMAQVGKTLCIASPPSRSARVQVSIALA